MQLGAERHAVRLSVRSRGLSNAEVRKPPMLDEGLNTMEE
jgi:hypothetical protein